MPRCLPFNPGEINCALTLLCQMIGNIIAFIGATSMVMSTPYKDVAGIDEAQMNIIINDVIYSKIVTGMCCTMIFGNTYYAWMAYRMMKKEKTTNVCTLPYGINTPAAFAFIFGVIAKASKEAAATGMSVEEGVLYAWRVGCVANLVSGFITTLCGFAGPLIVKVAPAASLMVALAGLGFTYLGIGQIIACFEVGHLGLLPLGVALITFFGDVKTSPLPAAVMVMVVGSLTGWLSFEGWPEGDPFPSGGTPEAVKESFSHFSFYFPSVLGPDSFKVIPAVLMKNLAVILPVAFVGAVNTLVSVYAAHSAGDMYPIRECLIVDGLTTVVAALFGSPFGTCVYCGHPQFKQQGGKIYYSFLNCIGFCFLASTGLFAACNALIPPWGIAPIILFVGLAINQDAFNVVESRHIPAAIVGLFPQTADWILSIWPGAPESKPGLAAMSYGALVVCIIWTSMGIFLIDRRFVQAGIWAMVASCLAGLGLIHQAEADLTFKTYSGSATQPFGRSPAAFQLGYMLLALLFGVLRILQNCGCSRVPPERKEVDDNDAEKEAEEVAERCNERPQTRIFDAMMSNEIAAGYEEQEDSEGGESTDDGDVGRP